MAAPTRTARQTLRDVGLAVALPVAATIGAATGFFTGSANGQSKTDPSQITLFIDEPTGNLIARQLSGVVPLSEEQHNLVLRSIVTEIAATIGLPKNTEVVEVVKAMMSDELEDRGLRDPVAYDSIISFAQDSRRRHIATTKEPIADAIRRGLDNPNIKSYTSDMSVGLYISNFRPSLYRGTSLPVPVPGRRSN